MYSVENVTKAMRVNLETHILDDLIFALAENDKYCAIAENKVVEFTHTDIKQFVAVHGYDPLAEAEKQLLLQQTQGQVIQDGIDKLRR